MAQTATRVKAFKRSRKPRPISVLDGGRLPVKQLATLAEREGRRPVPIYHAHRWFARRFSSAFRAILVAARLRTGADFWSAFYGGVDYSGVTVLDPFVGGGTSVVEAARMGAAAIGVDIDPVACAITNFELTAAGVPDLGAPLANLQAKVARRMGCYYTTVGPTGESRRVLHAFWVQIVRCGGCGQVVEAHPHYQLGFEADGDRQWVFCRYCHAIRELGRDVKSFQCRGCHRKTVIADGTVDEGELTCPECGSTERLIDVAERTKAKPKWRLFALETIPDDPGNRYPMAERQFQTATDADRARVTAAARALGRRQAPNEGWRWVPSRAIPMDGRSDSRLLHYRYQFYHELFNSRQLLHLSVLAEAIAATRGRAREALSLAFSDHLTTNCMLTYYAFGWRRLAPLFSIRAYRHVSRPVEINPWLDGTGRGTFPNAVRQVQRAVAFAKAPEVAHLKGGFVRSGSLAANGQRRAVLLGDSRSLHGVKDRSVDIILTDPPYFDNIAYSELSDFFLPWLQALGMVPKSDKGSCLPANLAARTRNRSGHSAFRQGLAQCFVQMRRVLKDGGRLVFSYQHRTPEAWESLGHALATAGWRPIQVFPMLGNSAAGLHPQDGTISWDAVVVCRKGTPRTTDGIAVDMSAVDAADGHVRRWRERLRKSKTSPFRNVDRNNLRRAALMAAGLGMFGRDPASDTRPLDELLREIP